LRRLSGAARWLWNQILEKLNAALLVAKAAVATGIRANLGFASNDAWI